MAKKDNADRELRSIQIDEKTKVAVIPMKRLITIVMLAFAIACNQEDPGPQMGCSTGMRNGTRHLLRCCTREQWLAGNNEAAGGISYFQNYTDHQWKSVKDCKECQ